MIFDYEKFLKMVSHEQGLYLSKKPYPFAYFDELFGDKILNLVNEEIDESKFEKDTRSIENIEVKMRSNFKDNESIPSNIKKVFDVLNGGKFLEIVTALTEVKGLISDPYFDGGGVNVIRNGGHLAVHVDGTTQRRMNISRRLNAILFLNDSWNENWNGYHEQWEMCDSNLDATDPEQKWRCVRKILPKKNRLVIFTTNDHSWHGHAGKLEVPENVERRSLITYYYTNGRPETDLIYEEPHSAIFINNNLTLTPNSYKDAEIIL